MMVYKISLEHRTWNMSRIKSQDTKPQLLLRSALHKAGFRFRLHVRELQGRSDIVLPKYHSAVFVHGCFWHRQNDCRNTTTPSTRREFWIEKLNIERDAKAKVALEAAGWNVFTVWEYELKSNPVEATQHLSVMLRRIS